MPLLQVCTTQTMIFSPPSHPTKGLYDGSIIIVSEVIEATQIGLLVPQIELMVLVCADGKFCLNIYCPRWKFFA